MQCKDIPDIPVLSFLAFHDCWCTWREQLPQCMPSVALAMPSGTEPALQLAKMKQLIKRGLVSGCGCGCRGDFEITEKGREILRRADTNGTPKWEPNEWNLSLKREMAVS